MFLCVISPAKNMNFSNAVPVVQTTSCCFPKERDVLLSHLRRLSVDQLQALLGVSESLAQLNYERLASFEAETTPERAAVFAYAGDVYAAMRPDEMSTAALERMNQRLLILSALYGVLRPFDRIRPYRLEMDAPLKKYTDWSVALAEYWQALVHSAVLQSMQALRAEYVVNLASDQYFSVLKGLPVPVLKIVFEDEKQGHYKPISFLLKKARGMMINYIMSHNIVNLEGLKAFSSGGYAFAEEASTPDILVFRRSERE